MCDAHVTHRVIDTDCASPLISRQCCIVPSGEVCHDAACHVKFAKNIKMLFIGDKTEI